MSARRAPVSPEIDARLRARQAPWEIVAWAKRKGVPCPSAATLSRRKAEMFGRQRVPQGGGASLTSRAGKVPPAPRAAKGGKLSARSRAEAPPSTPPELAGVDVTTADLATLDAWIATAQGLLAKSQEDDNLAGFASISRLLILAIARRAAMRPPPPQDPNEHPDFVAAAERARTKLHDLLARALEARGVDAVADEHSLVAVGLRRAAEIAEAHGAPAVARAIRAAAQENTR